MAARSPKMATGPALLGMPMKQASLLTVRARLGFGRSERNRAANVTGIAVNAAELGAHTGTRRLRDTSSTTVTD